MELSYSDRLKAIYDKEQALTNAILKADFSKVKEITEKDPQILTDKHLRLNETLKDSSTPYLASLRQDINTELSYTALINSSSYYTERNNLNIGEPTESLRTELASKDPSHKEPIVYHIKNGADLSLITKPNIERKLDDLNIKNYAGYKIAEDDQKEIVKFATIHALKTNNIDALKALEKEFAISKEIYLSENFIKSNSNTATFNYLRDTAITTPKEELSSAFISEQQLKVMYENKKLEIAISKGSVTDVHSAILNGADGKMINEKSLRHLDSTVQFDIMMATKDAQGLRKQAIPDYARFEFKQEQNQLLKDAVKNNDALKAYNAVKSGADISTLKQSDFDHLSQAQAKALKIELSKAINENAAKHSHSLPHNNNSHKQ